MNTLRFASGTIGISRHVRNRPRSFQSSPVRMTGYGRLIKKFELLAGLVEANVYSVPFDRLRVRLALGETGSLVKDASFRRNY
ncbi:MAG: hypothetical protein MUO42_11980 [Anaerolineaceae bacterium]|nr:hypothetical protein [Anaerolineaceae bacterium]